MDASTKQWGRWRDKLAAGFTVSASHSGDKLVDAATACSATSYGVGVSQARSHARKQQQHRVGQRPQPAGLVPGRDDSGKRRSGRRHHPGKRPEDSGSARRACREGSEALESRIKPPLKIQRGSPKVAISCRSAATVRVGGRQGFAESHWRPAVDIAQIRTAASIDRPGIVLVSLAGALERCLENPASLSLRTECKCPHGHLHSDLPPRAGSVSSIDGLRRGQSPVTDNSS